MCGYSPISSILTALCVFSVHAGLFPGFKKPPNSYMDWRIRSRAEFYVIFLYVYTQGVLGSYIIIASSKGPSKSLYGRVLASAKPSMHRSLIHVVTKCSIVLNLWLLRAHYSALSVSVSFAVCLSVCLSACLPVSVCMSVCSFKTVIKFCSEDLPTWLKYLLEH